MEILIKDIDHIGEAAREFISHIGEHRVFAFYGKMGAGKTTFVKAICEALGVTDVITSPTFAIVNEYSVNEELRMKNEESPTGIPSGEGVAAANSSFFILHSSFNKIYHFDFYRIKRLEEVYDMGYEEYFYSGHLCFIEWPELIDDILPEDTVRVTITEQPDGSRLVTA